MKRDSSRSVRGGVVGRRVVVGVATAAALVVGVVQGAPVFAGEGPVPLVSEKVVKGSLASGVEVGAGVPPVSAPVVAAGVPSGAFEVSVDGAARAGSVLVEAGEDGQALVVDGAWRELGGSGVAVAAAGDRVAVKDASAQLDSLRKGKGRAAAKDRAGKLRALFLDRDRVKKLGLSGPVLELKRADGRTGKASVGVRVPAKVLDAVFGADFASRARWVQVDVAKGPSSLEEVVSAGVPVPSVVTGKGEEIVVAPVVSARSVLLMPLAAPVGGKGTGDFTATSLRPSSEWDVSAQTGTFTWEYPLRVPPVAAGPSPDLSLSYDSQSVDGLTGSTNNQPSAVGEGWSLAGGGFI